MTATEPKPAKADVQTLAYLLKEIENRITEERASRKRGGFAMIVFGVLFFGLGILGTATNTLTHQQESALAAMTQQEPPPPPATSGAPLAIGAVMIAYGISKQW